MIQKINSRGRFVFAFLIALVLSLASSVQAVVPTAYTDAIDDVVADTSSLATTAFASLVGIALIVTLGHVAMQMVKKARSAV